MKQLKLSKEISLPLDVVTQTIAILAKRRAGKSYTMRKLVEQLLECNQQIVMVDPKGDQWGIRSLADGKSPGYPIVILGGEHGDAPLEASAGEVVAKLVVEDRVSVLLDLSLFRKHEVATFMGIFLENLYRLKAQEKYRTPMMLVIDEADAIAPQKPQKGEERMLGAADDIVRRGGQRGIGCALITQRSAVLNKNVLTQAQMLIVLRTIAPQDLSAMKAWIEVHGDLEQGKTLMDSLPSLPTGDAWFWSPGWPTDSGIFTRTHILPIETFDSGATPKPGEKVIIPKKLADVNLEVLKEKMAATIEKAKADNPVELKKKIAELEKQLKNEPHKFAVKQTYIPDPKIMEEAIKKAVTKALSAQGLKQVKEQNKRLEVFKKIQSLIQPFVDDGIALYSAHNEMIDIYRPEPIINRVQPIQPRDGAITKIESDISQPQQKILDAIAWFNSADIQSPTRNQVAFLSDQSPSSSGYANNLSGLKTKGLIDYTKPGEISLTEIGSYTARTPIGALTTEDLHQKIQAKLSRPQWAILSVLINASSGYALSKEDLAAQSGQSISSSGYANNLSSLRSLGFIDYPTPGMVLARPILFI